MFFYFSLAILLLSLGAQIYLRSFGHRRRLTRIRSISIFGRSDFPRQGEDRPLGAANINVNIRKSDLLKYIFIVSIFIIFLLLFYQSYQQFQIWSQNELSKFLLPPYQPLNYFLFYVGVRFFAQYLISLAAAFIFIIAAKFLNKKYKERFFYEEEFYLGAIGLFLSGHPGWLFYVISLLLIYLLMHLYSLFIIPAFLRLKSQNLAGRHNSSQRISLYWLWIPMAIFVILIQSWLQELAIWQILKI